MNISDIKTLTADKTPIDSISGTVKIAKDPGEKESQYGTTRIQWLLVEDTTDSVVVIIKTQKDAKPPNWMQIFEEGDALTFVSKPGQKGSTGVRYDTWTKQDGTPTGAVVVTASALFRSNSGGAAKPVTGDVVDYSAVNSQRFGVVEAGEIVKYFLELFGRPTDTNYIELVKSVACTVIIQASQNKIALDYKEKKEEKKEEEAPGPDAQDLGAPGSEDNMEDIPF